MIGAAFPGVAAAGGAAAGGVGLGSILGAAGTAGLSMLPMLLSGGGGGTFGQPIQPYQAPAPSAPLDGGQAGALPALTELRNTLPQSFAAPSVQPTPGAPDWFKAGSTPQPEQPNGLQSFLGNLDSNLQRPSMGLGLGLLGQASPYLPYAGLLAMGLLDPKRLGGQ